MRFFLGIFLFLSSTLSGCVGVPDNVTPVTGFDVDRYLGTWHEIARLDHKFERGLTNVSATYSLRDDGGLRVINRGFNQAKNEWKQAEGKAYFVSDTTTGHLKVSFFWIFYGSYVIMDLDHENYDYALVCGPNLKYLWILGRSTTLDEGIKTRLVEKARLAGFPTDDLIWVTHDTPTHP